MAYTNFLFGENLEERVLLPTKEEVQNDTKKEETEDDGENSVASKLPEKRKYEVITGEEDESNVLQIFCKLYLWDPESAFWKEKGKGMLRLNDKMKDDKICSRLVMRTAGSLKVILNASIVTGMKFELSNENCLRFINIDGIYLFKGKEKDIEQLNSAIECRLRELSKKVKVDDNDDDNQEDTVNEPSEGANSKTSEDSAEDSKEELRQPDIEGSQLKKELENNEIDKNEDVDENSRKENVSEKEEKEEEKETDKETETITRKGTEKETPEEKEKEESQTCEQNEDHSGEKQQQSTNSKSESNKETEETSTCPPDLDQK